MSLPIDGLLELLDLDESDPDVFIGPPSGEPHVRAFGGQVAAQALVAAGSTVDRPCHSLHSYFLRPGRPDEPITYRVERVRDGRSFSTRRVEAVQNEQVIFHLTASFHSPEPGVEHQDAMPATPDPESLAPFDVRFAGRDEAADMGLWFGRARPFDIRYVDHTPFDPPTPNHPPEQRVWIKTASPVADERVLVHQAVAAYASDMTLLDSILMSHEMRWTDRQVLGASLDHAMWFHQPFRADEWLLYDQRSPIARGARGLAEGRVWTTDGRLVISVVQEALLRPPAHFTG